MQVQSTKMRAEEDDPAKARIRWPYTPAPGGPGTFRGQLCGVDFRLTVKTARKDDTSILDMTVEYCGADPAVPSRKYGCRYLGQDVTSMRREHMRPFIRESIQALLREQDGLL